MQIRDYKYAFLRIKVYEAVVLLILFAIGLLYERVVNFCVLWHEINNLMIFFVLAAKTLF